jgi:hypothetical protein
VNEALLQAEEIVLPSAVNPTLQTATICPRNKCIQLGVQKSKPEAHSFVIIVQSLPKNGAVTDMKCFFGKIICTRDNFQCFFARLP